MISWQEPLVVTKLSAAETDERAMTRTVLHPAVNHALTVENVLRRDLSELHLNDLVAALSAQRAAVFNGGMERPEALLTAQAQTQIRATLGNLKNPPTIGSQGRKGAVIDELACRAELTG